jgi:hypothetical protein
MCAGERLFCLPLPFLRDYGIVFLEPQLTAVHFFLGGKMKDKLDSLIDGRRDGRNGWDNKKRKQSDRAYEVGWALGAHEYRQFLIGPNNPIPGYVPPELPKEILVPFLELLTADSDKSGERPRRFESLTDLAVLSSPVANWPFDRAFSLQLDTLTPSGTEQIYRSALC